MFAVRHRIRVSRSIVATVAIAAAAMPFHHPGVRR